VVDDADLEPAAAELAARLAAQPPLAIRGARRAIDAAWHEDPESAFSVAVQEQIRCLASNDFTRGLQAMAEGRTPRWQGR
jgi:enoyl-CoA hydratase/2-(1,2-epoxy-1,2-dihydrophenyl)acetyl-CoA isomerase